MITRRLHIIRKGRPFQNTRAIITTEVSPLNTAGIGPLATGVADLTAFVGGRGVDAEEVGVGELAGESVGAGVDGAGGADAGCGGGEGGCGGGVLGWRLVSGGGGLQEVIQV